MPIIRVDETAFSTAVEDMSNVFKRLTETLDNMEAELLPLSEQLAGESYEAFVQAKKRWNSRMSHMSALLNAAAGLTGHGGAAFVEQDNAHAAVWQ